MIPLSHPLDFGIVAYFQYMKICFLTAVAATVAFALSGCGSTNAEDLEAATEQQWQPSSREPTLRPWIRFANVIESPGRFRELCRLGSVGAPLW